MYYAVVLHDFQAERTDELDARAGDAVSVVAQSNREWFVAKPIGKLGRPGLIPVSFVEVRDPTTNQAITDINTLLESGGLPNVDEWKQDMVTYKANSIALGVLDDPSSLAGGGGPSPTSPQSTSPRSPDIPPQGFSAQSDTGYPTTPQAPPSANNGLLPDGILLSADVVSFHYEMEEYWFRVHALFQPYEAAGTQSLPPARQLVLFRAYNDFYDFQVDLLNVFPREAGREPPHPRVLPYMPGPAEDVSHKITASRQAELDEYLHKLCDLQQSASRYVLEDQVVRAFVSPKPGDVETATDPRVEEIAALSGYGGYAADELERGVVGQMAGMRLSERRPGSGVSEYGDEFTRQRESRNGSRSNSRGQSLRPDYQGHERSDSMSSQRNPSPLPPHMRPDSAAPRAGGAHQRSGSRSAAQSMYDQDRYSQYSTTSSPQYDGSGPPSGGSGGRSRSGSTATAMNTSSPPISSTNPNTAFVKIKIFVADDLIAVRVHPRVTLDQLLDKVSNRVGAAVAGLQYREGDEFVDVEGDPDLREWIEITEKHVLYAA